MLEQFKNKINQFQQRDNQKLFLLGGATIFITALVMFFMLRGSQNYIALFGKQERVPVAQVIEVLSSESIPYRVEPNSGQFLVQEESLAKAKMLLASKGVNALKPEGYELMDKEAMLGSSHFMQNVRFRRSLEGELAQSIMTLDPVAYARVHLGLNDDSSFVLSNQPKSTASVVVRLHFGKQLSDEQIGAIMQLVAGSTPGLSTENVQVVDQEGRLLSDRYDAREGSVFAAKNSADMVKRIQNDIEKNIGHLLASLVGNHNYRISVMPKIDFSRIEETQERYGTEPKVSTESINQENTSEDLAQGVPGSLSNRPANPRNTAGAANTNLPSYRNQAERRYAYDREIKHIRYPGFKIEKISIAIVLNNEAPEIKDWNDDQLTQLNKLITDAAGIDNQRGDSLSVSLMKFTIQPVSEEQPIDWWENPTIIYWAENMGIGLLALLLLLFGINPLLRRLGTPSSSGHTVAANQDGENGEYYSEELDESTPAEAKKAFQNDGNLPPQSSGLETKTEYLQMLAEIETERVAEVIKQWINTNDRNTAKS